LNFQIKGERVGKRGSNDNTTGHIKKVGSHHQLSSSSLIKMNHIENISDNIDSLDRLKTTIRSTNIQRLRAKKANAYNRKMTNYTIILVTCIFFLLTLPIMLFIVFDKFIYIQRSVKGSLLQNDGNKKTFLFLINSKTMNVMKILFFKKDFNVNETNHSMSILVVTDRHFESIFDMLKLETNCKAVLWACVNILMYTNHSINFVLYCLTGSKFRQEVSSFFSSKFQNNKKVVLFSNQNSVI
jgi:hypothetical protein